MSAVQGLAEFEARMLQGQDGITTGSDCSISGDFNICPAQADFTFGTGVKRLTADLKCPFDAVQQSDFRQASQEGLCECDATVLDLNQTDASPEPLSCECFICPDQPDLVGVAYTCETPISGPCYTFDCSGNCNGDLNFLPGATKAPTAAPVAPGAGDAAFGIDAPVVATAAMLMLTIVRMFH